MCGCDHNHGGRSEAGKDFDGLLVGDPNEPGFSTTSVIPDCPECGNDPVRDGNGPNDAHVVEIAPVRDSAFRIVERLGAFVSERACGCRDWRILQALSDASSLASDLMSVPDFDAMQPVPVPPDTQAVDPMSERYVVLLQLCAGAVNDHLVRQVLDVVEPRNKEAARALSEYIEGSFDLVKDRVERALNGEVLRLQNRFPQERRRTVHEESAGTAFKRILATSRRQLLLMAFTSPHEDFVDTLVRQFSGDYLEAVRCGSVDAPAGGEVFLPSVSVDPPEHDENGFTLAGGQAIWTFSLEVVDPRTLEPRRCNRHNIVDPKPKTRKRKTNEKKSLQK